nr:MAG TPA: Glycogen debranching enzyme [Siphoviridae sp. ctedi74]
MTRMTLALSIGEDLIITFQPSLDSTTYSLPPCSW